MCKKHTQTLKSDRFAPNFIWNLSDFWVFLKVPKIKVLFVSDWLLTKSYFCTEPAHGGRYENGASFYLPPFLSGNFTLKILTEVMGEENKMTDIFSSLTKILWSFFHKTASQGLLCCPLPLTRPLPQPPRHAPINAKKAARFLLPPSGFRNHLSGKP